MRWLISSEVISLAADAGRTDPERVNGMVICVDAHAWVNGFACGGGLGRTTVTCLIASHASRTANDASDLVDDVVSARGSGTETDSVNESESVSKTATCDGGDVVNAVSRGVRDQQLASVAAVARHGVGSPHGVGPAHDG